VRCEVLRGRGGMVIVCGGRRQRQPACYRDGKPASVQCDQVVGQRDTGVALMPVTCDRWCCTDTSCSVQVGPNRHQCRSHFDAAAKADRASQEAKGATP
jgi:hypothetical protein